MHSQPRTATRGRRHQAQHGIGWERLQGRGFVTGMVSGQKQEGDEEQSNDTTPSVFLSSFRLQGLPRFNSVNEGMLSTHAIFSQPNVFFYSI